MGTERKQGGIVNQLFEEDARLSRIIDKRRNIYGLVGTGEVSPYNSADEALRIGKVKIGIIENIEERESERAEVSKRLDIYNSANDIIVELKDGKKKLDDMKGMVKEGHLSMGVFKHYEEKLHELEIDLRSDDPEISKAVDDLIMEEESRKREFVLPDGNVTKGAGAQLLNIAAQGSSDKPIPLEVLLGSIYPGENRGSADRKFTNAKTRVKEMLQDTDLKLVYIHEKDREDGKTGYYLHGLEAGKQEDKEYSEQSYELPNGDKITGKRAHLLGLVSRRSIDYPATKEELMKELYPEIDRKITIGRFNTLRQETREILDGTGLELLHIHKSESVSGESGYVLTDWSNALGIKIGRSSPQSMVDVSEVVLDQGKNKVAKVLRGINSDLATQHQRLNCYPSTKAVESCYADQVRKKQINVELIESRLIIEGEILHLTSDQTKVFGTLMRMGRPHVDYAEIVKREFPDLSGDKAIGKVNKVLGELEKEIYDTIGVDNIVTKGVDPKSNRWVKLKDVKKGVYACEKLSDDNLGVLTQTFSSDFSKEQIYKALGKTKKGIKFTWNQASHSIMGRVRMLRGRVYAGVADEGELALFKKIESCLKRNGYDMNAKGELGNYLEERLK